MSGYGRGARMCAHPIRLAGTEHRLDRRTGELSALPDREAAGVLLTACGNRRSARCPACSALYRADTWQLIAAGLRGGKGLPETITEHPRLFITLTAPAFGPVHSRRTHRAAARTCRPRAGHCPHQQPSGCALRHPVGDRQLGTPLCQQCFDYPGAVLWNAHVGELWRRTSIRWQRALAHQVGLTPAGLARQLRISYTKVAEFQARGLVHLHAVARLDAAPIPGQSPQPPPARFTAELLTAAIRASTRQVAAPIPGREAGTGSPAWAGWGPQFDIRTITAGSNEANPTAIAAYTAKYATKSLTGNNGAAMDRPLRPADIAGLDPARHLDRMALTCWQLGAQPDLQHLKLRRWAHMLGYRGHFSTRSRAYSTTLRQLRQARTAWTAHSTTDPGEWTTWRYTGRADPHPAGTIITEEH